MPGNIHFWWTVGLPALPTIGVAVVTYIQTVPPWVAILLILLVYCLALGGSLVVRQKWWSRSRSHTAYTSLQLDGDLRERCCKLSAEIFEFYRRERENAKQTLRSDWGMVFLEEPHHRNQRRSEITERHENEMVDRYSEQLGGKVSGLCDDLEPHGWCSPEDRNRFENPTGAQDIRYTAQRLDAICDWSSKS